MLHLTRGTNFLLLFMFLVSLVHHHHPALLHRHTLILDCLLDISHGVFHSRLKTLFFSSLSLHSHLYVAQADLDFDHSVFGSHWR